MKKLTVIFLIVALLLGGIVPISAEQNSVTDIVPDVSWFSSRSTEHHLSSVEDLFGFLDLIKSGNTFSNSVIYLDADITVNEADLSDLSQADTDTLVSWTDIGDKNFFKIHS